jgi:tRNA/tmRNA/rRNA uracil-C5-methylase (TrmA/RlmC/RlmD family)
LYGSAHIKEIVTTDMRKPPKLRFPPLVFRQANIDAFSNIIRNIRMWIKAFVLPVPNDSSVDLERLTQTDDEGNEEEKKDTSQAPLINCVELYGGVGTIGLNCLDLFSSLHCSDENPNNKVCFDSTLAKMSSSIRTRAVYESKGASTIASSGGLRGYDIVIVDPPRKGLDDDVIDALLAYHPDSKRARGGLAAGCDTEHGRQNNSRLIYVSCGFKAFKRDMSRLTGEGVDGVSNSESDRVDVSYFIPKVGIDGSGSGDVANNSSEGNKKRTRLWKIIHAEGHVLFPGSDHIETFAILDRV